MKIDKINKEEKGCRNCRKFVAIFSCWERMKGNGEQCKKFSPYITK